MQSINGNKLSSTIVFDKFYPIVKSLELRFFKITLNAMIMTSASNHESLIGTELFSLTKLKVWIFSVIGTQQAVKDYDSYGRENEWSECLMTGLASFWKHFLIPSTRRGNKAEHGMSLSWGHRDHSSGRTLRKMECSQQNTKENGAKYRKSSQNLHKEHYVSLP